MMPKINLLGSRYGRLVVVAEATLEPGKIRWTCRCDCGQEVVCSTSNLRRGGHTSCGCRRREKFAERGVVRGHSGPADFSKAWTAIKARCYSAGHPNYKDYGARGIGMDPAWRANFEEFSAWILGNIGERPSPKHSLDRIDNDRGYEPGNLRWATRVEQMANTRAKISNAQFDEMRVERDLWRQRALDLGWNPEGILRVSPS